MKMTSKEFKEFTAQPKNESELQQQCMKWFDSTYPNLYFKLFAIPNGGHRSITTATRLKREGVKSGVWDLQLLVQNGVYAGLFLEAKFGNNKLTPNQIAFMEDNQAMFGFKVFYTVEDFKAIIINWIG